MEITHYYPFGMIWTGTWQNQNNMLLENKYGYNGKEEISGIGLLDYGFRFYDPAIARFTTIDPLTESFPHQSGYVYADNNPIKFIDFMGLSSSYNWDTGVYEDEDGNEVSWNDVQSEYGIGNSTTSTPFEALDLGAENQLNEVVDFFKRINDLTIEAERTKIPAQGSYSDPDVEDFEYTIDNYPLRLDQCFDFGCVTNNYTRGFSKGGNYWKMGNDDYSITVQLESFMNREGYYNVHIVSEEIKGIRAYQNIYRINLNTSTLDWKISLTTKNKELYESWKKTIGLL